MSTTNYVQKWNGTQIVDSLIFDDGTNVGVGTSAPKTQVDVSGASQAVTTTWNDIGATGATLTLRESSGSSNAYKGGAILFGAGQGNFAFIQGGIIGSTGPAGILNFGTRTSSGSITTRMTIDAAGNVGIATTSPSGLLHVQPSGSDSSNVVVQPSGGVLADGSSWAVSMVRINRTQNADGQNQFGLNVQVSSTSQSSSSTPYEKSAILGQAKTKDNAALTKPVTTRDSVGIVGSGLIYYDTPNTVNSASVWGMQAVASIQNDGSGTVKADGSLVGLEVDVENGGSDVTDMTSPLEKIGILIVAEDSSDSTGILLTRHATAAIRVTGETYTRWHKVLYADSGAFLSPPASSDSFLEIQDKFIVKPDGKVGIGTVSPLAPFHCVGPFLVDGAGSQNTFRGLSSTTDTRVKIDSGASGTARQSILALSDQNTNKWEIVKAADNHFLIWDTASSADRFHIAPDGNVGIGGAPSYKLHVFGVYAAIVGGSTSSDTRFLIDSGSGPTVKQSVVGFLDRGTDKWEILKRDDNNFSVYDTSSAVTRLLLDTSGNFGFNGSSFGGGAQIIFIANAFAVPSSNPSGGGILFVDSGALKYRGSGGTVTTLGPA